MEKMPVAENLFKFGRMIGTAATTYYRNLPAESQRPFYLDTTNSKERVHHGLAGLILTGICLIGANSDDDTIKSLSAIGLGIGTTLIEDDIGDIDRWIWDLFR